MAEQFFVEPDADRPEILVRGDGLTIAERILPSDASWTHISSLASWAWDSSGVEVTRAQAEEIAAEWGATL